VNIRTVMPVTMASNFMKGFTAVTQQTPAPMTIGNMRANGVRSLIVICTNVTCRHEAIVNVDGQSDAAFVPALSRLMRCQQCGQRGADVRPNWNERNARAPVTQSSA
jgi:hypothetical protein